ncbi:MAG: EpsG family protein [Bacteroidaceae bacterium]|nr:EpsG family protein [Bacteroidaceae bacterium]
MFLITGFHNGYGDRYGYGYDFPEYMHYFQGKSSIYGYLDHYDLELPYYYFCKLLGFLGKSDFVYIFGCALFFGIPFVLFVKKYSNNYPVSFFLLFTILNTSIFLTFLAAHRQMIATTMFMWGIYFYYNFKIKGVNWKSKLKSSLICCFIIIALLAHSSSYFVLPFIIIVYCINIDDIKAQYLLWGSFFIGLLLVPELQVIFSEFIIKLSVFDVLDRTTHYTTENIYEYNEVGIFNLLPLTLLVSLAVFYSKKEEIKTFHTKSMIFAAVMRNLFFTIPLINRGLFLFILVGITGFIPPSIKHSKCYKVLFFMLMILFLYLAYRNYTSKSFRLNPFNFIWE